MTMITFKEFLPRDARSASAELLSYVGVARPSGRLSVRLSVRDVDVR